jgi:hypothetical protein
LRLDKRAKSPAWEARFTINAGKRSQKLGTVTEDMTRADAPSHQRAVEPALA